MSISYVIRTCNADFTSRNDFKWPALGEVVCPDFEASQECGAGLHGFLDGCGDGSLASWKSDAQWLLVAVPTDMLIDLEGKVKFPSGEVVFSSQDRLTVIAELERLNPETRNEPVIGAVRSSMKKGAHVFTGDYGTSTSGDYGTSTSGKYGTSNSGEGGTSTSGNSGTATSGVYGTSTSGAWGTSISGNGGTSISAHCGTSTSGDFGTSISMDLGTSISGAHGTSTVGFSGKAKSGLNGNLIFFYHDDKIGYRKSASFFVDGVTVKADTFYRCENGQLVEVF